MNKLNRAEKAARYLRKDSQLTVSEIAFLLGKSDRTVQRYLEDTGDDQDVMSLDSAKTDSQANLAMAERFLMKRAQKGEFDELWCQLTTAAKRQAEISKILIDDAPFDSAKVLLEGITAAQERIRQRDDIPAKAKQTASNVLGLIYEDVLAGDNG